MKYLWGVLLLCLIPVSVSGQTGTLADCQLSTVQRRVNNALTVDGSVITLPACTGVAGQWNGTLSINQKSITIRGSGRDATYITNIQANTASMLYWNTKSSGVVKLSDMTFDSGVDTIHVDEHERELVMIEGNNPNFILQNVKFWVHRQGIPGPNNGSTSEAIIIRGYVRGVASQNIFHWAVFDAVAQVIHWSWGNHSSDMSWATDHTMGTTEAMVFEDNEFQCFIDFYCPGLNLWGGGRLAFRFNRVTNAQIYQHGLDTPGRPRGARQWEYYNNIGANNVNTGASLFAPRGGTGRVFNNRFTVSGSSSSTNLVDGWTQRAAQNPPIGVTFDPWGDCRVRTVQSISCSRGVATVTGPSVNAPDTSVGFKRGFWVTIAGSSIGAYNGTFAVTGPTGQNRQTTTFTFNATCGGTASNMGITVRSPFDGNVSGVNGAPCMDQLARGKGALLSTGYDAFSGLTAVASAQQREQIYLWSNTRNGVASPFVLSGSMDNSIVTQNVDWFDNNTGGCNAGAGSCTAGVGRGVRAVRPTNCTTGVGWWATDQGNWNTEDAARHALHDPSSLTHTIGEDGVLDVCVSTNSWSNAYYVPLAYPHELLGGGGGGPVDTPPTVTILTPTASDTYDTTTGTMTLTGTASDDTGVLSVARSINGGAYSSCTGTTAAWTCASLTLSAGTNTIIVRATDTASQTGTDSLIVVHVDCGASATDDFTRGDAPSLGPCWTIQTTSLPLSFVSNAAKGTMQYQNHCSYWNAHAFSTDQRSEAVIGALYTDSFLGVVVRTKETDSSRDAYMMVLEGRATSGYTVIAKVVNGVQTNIFPFAVSWAAGDSMALEAIGSSPTLLIAYQKVGAGSWVELGRGEDSEATLQSGGAAGICLYGPNVSLASWAGR